MLTKISAVESWAECKTLHLETKNTLQIENGSLGFYFQFDIFLA